MSAEALLTEAKRQESDDELFFLINSASRCYCYIDQSLKWVFVGVGRKAAKGQKVAGTRIKGSEVKHGVKSFDILNTVAGKNTG